MLTHLQLKHIAITDHLDLDVSNGLTVITGETGAGKSIIINALKLLAGERAPSGLVKHGHEKGSVCAEFDLHDLDQAKAWLQAHDFYEDDQCQLRRVLSEDGRSKAYINGHACTLNDLKTLSKYLISVHGQHEGQQLLNEKHQQHLLDAYGQSLTLLKQTQQAHSHWQALKKQRDELLAKSKAGAQQLEFLRFQFDELKDLNLEPEYIQSLDEEQKGLSNADTLLSEGQTALSILRDDDGACDQLNAALQHINKLALPQKSEWADSLNQALIQAEEVARDIEHAIERFDNDPARLADIEEALSKLHELSRKHRTTPDQLLALRDSIEASINDIDHSDEHLKALEAQINQAEKSYLDCAKKLSALRKKSAKTLSEKISDFIKQLGMPKAEFIVQLITQDTPSAQGLERVRFDAHLNPGQKPDALSKIASGGELSRISLAIHVATAECEKTPTLIFDEVDTGISGHVANVVGQLLATLSQNAQILCITHLAAVAAKGQHHLYVEKSSTDDSTSSHIRALSREERVAELAFMTSGKSDDQTARALAEKLLA